MNKIKTTTIKGEIARTGINNSRHVIYSVLNLCKYTNTL
jgi:hypothetical protein